MENGHPFHQRHLQLQVTSAPRDLTQGDDYESKNSHNNRKERKAASWRREVDKFDDKNEDLENCGGISPPPTPPPIDLSVRRSSSKNNNRSELLRREMAKCRQLGLPLNPNAWTLPHVVTWLRHLSTLHCFPIEYSRFLMNGKALCFMSLAGFKWRCPRGGKILHSDLQRKMIAHIYLLVLQNHHHKSTEITTSKNLAMLRRST